MTVEYVILSGARSAKSKNPKKKARFLDYARNDGKENARNDTFSCHSELVEESRVTCHSEPAEESQKESEISRLRSK